MKFNKMKLAVIVVSLLVIVLIGFLATRYYLAPSLTHIEYIDDWIYFLQNDGLYRTELDNNELEDIYMRQGEAGYRDWYWFYRMYEQKIYVMDGNIIYQIAADGSNKTIVAENVHPFYALGAPRSALGFEIKDGILYCAELPYGSWVEEENQKLHPIIAVSLSDHTKERHLIEGDGRNSNIIYVTNEHIYMLALTSNDYPVPLNDRMDHLSLYRYSLATRKNELIIPDL